MEWDENDIGISEAVAMIRSEPGCENFHGSTIRKHCIEGTFVGAKKTNRNWRFSKEALKVWRDEYYKPRKPYEKWFCALCDRCGEKVYKERT